MEAAVDLVNAVGGGADALIRRATFRHAPGMARGGRGGYNKGMKPKTSKPIEIAEPNSGQTRPPQAALNEGVAESFAEVEPEGFEDHPRSSIYAALSDPDVDDSEGGE